MNLMKKGAVQAQRLVNHFDGFKKLKGYY